MSNIPTIRPDGEPKIVREGYRMLDKDEDPMIGDELTLDSGKTWHPWRPGSNICPTPTEVFCRRLPVAPEGEE